MSTTTTDPALLEVSYKYNSTISVKVKGTAEQVIKAINEFNKQVNNQKQVE